MPLRNKNYIAYLGALTLLFSYAEMFLPRTVPFFRLGLGNAVMLLALPLDFSSFMLLSVIKAFTASLLAGTLFSPFFILSLAQSISSGLCMYVLYRIISKKIVSLYGISIFGSAASAVVQIILASLYLGEGTYALLAPMLYFSIFSGIVTAFMALHLHIPQAAPALTYSKAFNDSLDTQQVQAAKRKAIAFVTIILIAAIFTLMQQSIAILAICLFASLAAQKFSHRRILILPHVSLWIFVIVANIISPSGKVIYHIGSWALTQGALTLGIVQALKLSTVSALSQCAANIQLPGKSLPALTLAYFRGLANTLRAADGNIIKKIRTALAATEISK